MCWLIKKIPLKRERVEREPIDLKDLRVKDNNSDCKFQTQMQHPVMILWRKLRYNDRTERSKD